MPLVRAQVTILNPFVDDSESRSWRAAVDRHIQESFETADRIFGSHGIHVTQYRSSLAVGAAASQRLLTRDIQFLAGSAPGAYEAALQRAHAAGEARYQELLAEGVSAPHHLHAEYFLNTSLSYGVGNLAGLASGEALEILRLNRQTGCVAVYWVPGIAGTTALSLFDPCYSNVRAEEEGIFMRPGTGADTLAHELGHLLIRCGHCEYPDDPRHDAVTCNCAGPDNLMHGSGDARRAPATPAHLRQFFNRGQAARLLREAGARGYLTA